MGDICQHARVYIHTSIAPRHHHHHRIILQGRYKLQCQSGRESLSQKRAINEMSGCPSHPLRSEVDCRPCVRVSRSAKRPICTSPSHHHPPPTTYHRYRNNSLGCALLAFARSPALDGCLPGESPSPLLSCARRSSSSIFHIPWMKPSRSSAPFPVGSHSSLRRTRASANATNSDTSRLRTISP